MLRTEVGKWFRKLFLRGSNSDIDANLLPDGAYRDSKNMRPSSTTGNSGALKRLNGEVQGYGVTDAGADTYECIGTISINGHLVEFWCSTDGATYPPLIRIDGVTCAKSFNIPYRYDRPLQLAPIEQCKSAGLVYAADHNSDLLYWDIGDMIQNNPNNDNTQLYFGGYTLEQNTVGLNAAPLIPWFDKAEALVNLVGGVGLPTGQYSYSARYRTPLGDYTEWGPETPLISVPAINTPNGQASFNQIEDDAYRIYPGGRTIGGEPNTLINTPYGVKIRMRIDNPFGYESVEFKRRRYNQGAGITDAGIEEIIARVTIVVDQNNIITLIDPSDQNVAIETVPPAESAPRLLQPRAPKCVEYADNRVTVANFTVDAQPEDITFREVDGRKMTAITEKLVKVVGTEEIPNGYDDPYNGAYKKSAKRGDSYRYGLATWNHSQGLFYATDIKEPFVAGSDEMPYPQRRDIKGDTNFTLQNNYGADSSTYSDDQIWAATNDVTSASAQGPVSGTFDVMTQGDGAKTDVKQVVNVSEPGASVGRDALEFVEFAPLPAYPSDSVQPVLGNFVPTAGNGYQPWHPTGNADTEVRSWNVLPNTLRLRGATGTGLNNPQSSDFSPQITFNDPLDARGRIFGPKYQALGALIYGPQNIPDTVSAFTIGRSERAGTVIMQGFGSYDITFNGAILQANPATKSTTSLLVHFPELAAGVVDQATIDDMQANPSRYKLRFTPYGYYTEVYGYSGEEIGPGEAWVPACIASWAMDMVSYGRIMHDEGQVNVGDTAPMGYHPIIGSPAPPGNYVGPDKWRSDQNMQGGPPGGINYSYWQDQGSGATLFDLSGIEQLTSGRSTFYRVSTEQYIYSPDCYTVTDGVGTNHTAMDDPIVRAFHQPWYVIDVVRLNAEVPEANSQPYINTGCHVAVNTRIGYYTTEQDTFELLGEREWLDCVGYLPDDYRYTYVLSPNGGEQRFLCVTNNAVINIPAIQADILSNGFWIAPDGLPVYGLYEMLVADDGTRSLRYGIYNTFPDIGASIFVRYDNNAPLRVFGHDITIAPSIHAVADNQVSRDNVDNNTGFGQPLNGLPVLPFAGFGMNPRYFMPEAGFQTEEQIRVNYLASIRQWCIVWDAETRIQTQLFINATSTPQNRLDQQQFFPAVHYVNRLYKFNGDNPPSSGANAGFFGQYDIDYPDETAIWKFGGIRFLPDHNLDYAKLATPSYFGIPKAGWRPRTDYCTGKIASNIFDPTQQDVPNLRTFTIDNLVLLSEETGEIKMISSASSDAFGQNMHWWTQRGHGYTPTNKRILTGASAELIATQSIDKYWGDPVFMSRTLGLPDEFWRMFIMCVAEGNNSMADTFIWPTREDIYRMSPGSRAVPIGRSKWLKEALPYLQAIGTGYDDRVTAAYDSVNDEYHLCIIPTGTGRDLREPFVFSPVSNEWQGRYGNRFDRYAMHNGKLWGMRVLTSYKTDDSGFTQNGAQMSSYADMPFVPNMGIRHDAQGFRVHPSKPTRIEIRDKDYNLVFFTDQVTQEAASPGTGADWVLQIDGWQQAIGRKNLSIDLDQDRVQDEVFYLRAYYDGDENSVIVSAQLQLYQLI